MVLRATQKDAMASSDEQAWDLRTSLPSPLLHKTLEYKEAYGTVVPFLGRSGERNEPPPKGAKVERPAIIKQCPG